MNTRAPATHAARRTNYDLRLPLYAELVYVATRRLPTFVFMQQLLLALHFIPADANFLERLGHHVSAYYKKTLASLHWD